MRRLWGRAVVVGLVLLGLTSAWAWSDPPQPEGGLSGGENFSESGSSLLSSPFYLFREWPRHVWLERIYLTVTDPEGEKLARELEQPSLRAAIYEALQRSQDNVEEEVRRELKRLLGEEASRRVGLSRAFLLGP